MGSISLVVGQAWPFCHATSASWGTVAAWHVLWWGLIAGLVVVGIVTLTRRTRSAAGSSAEAILDERYARGELTRDEYEERRAVLG